MVKTVLDTVHLWAVISIKANVETALESLGVKVAMSA
jgi:hypothetical protein